MAQRVAANTSSDHLLSLGDVFATLADITGDTLTADEGEDSVSFLSLLSGDDQPTREAAVYHSQQGVFAIAKELGVYRCAIRR